MGFNFSWHQVGKRKSAVARIWMRRGTGKFVINRRTVDDYFGGHETYKLVINQPLALTSGAGQYDIFANVGGGGLAGQAGAIRHGIAKVLSALNPDFRAVLKRAGLITRDARKKERKKYGLRSARRRFQFSKR